MKVIVKKYLNVRVGKPSVNAPCYQYLAPGSELEVDGEYYKGDVYDGINTWLKDLVGNYYWSGGLEIPQESHQIKSIENINWHISKLGIDKLWSKTKGEGVKVAIIDSGISSSHPDIDFSKVILRKNFLYDGDDENLINDVEDQIGHGTHCAGIVAAQGIKTYGVAPNVNLLVGKITNSLNGLDQKILFQAIEWAYNNEADVISISISLDKFNKDYIKNLEVLDVKSKGILLGALSNLGDQGYNVEGYPFSLTTCVGVGAINKEFQIDVDTSRSNSLDILAPGRDIFSTWKGSTYKEESGCSMSTPIVAGIIALIISYAKQHSETLSKEEIINLIKSKTSTFRKFRTLENFSFPIIDPLNIFSNF